MVVPAYLRVITFLDTNARVLDFNNILTIIYGGYESNYFLTGLHGGIFMITVFNNVRRYQGAKYMQHIL